MRWCVAAAVFFMCGSSEASDFFTPRTQVIQVLQNGRLVTKYATIYAGYYMGQNPHVYRSTTPVNQYERRQWYPKSDGSGWNRYPEPKH